MAKVAKAILTGAPPLVAGGMIFLATQDLSEATSTLSKNLQLFGIMAPPEWLLAKATDGWVVGIGVAIIVVWGAALWWLHREGKGDREVYRAKLQEMQIIHQNALHLVFSAGTDAAFEGLIPDLNEVANATTAWLKGNMGEAAVAKYIGGNALGMDYNWAGDHSAEAREQRNRIITSLRVRVEQIEALMGSGNWDHPVPLKKRQRAAKRQKRKQWIWSKPPMRWFASGAT